MFTKRSDELINKVFEDFFGDNPFINSYQWDVTNKGLKKRDISENTPSTNVIETKGDFRYELATPGFDKKDIKVELEDNVLTIRGEKSIENEVKEREYLSKEFRFSKFKRNYDIPENVVIDEIYAKVENGITTLFLPKEKLGKPKKVSRTIDII